MESFSPLCQNRGQSRIAADSNNYCFEDQTLLCIVVGRALMEEPSPVCVINSIFASILNRLVPFRKAGSVCEDE